MKLEFWNAWPDLCEPCYQGWNDHELLLYSLVEVLRGIKSPTGWPSEVVDLHYPRLKKYQYQHLITEDFYIKLAKLNQRIEYISLRDMYSHLLKNLIIDYFLLAGFHFNRFLPG